MVERRSPKPNVVSAVKVVIVSTILVAFFLGVVDTFFVACLGWFF